jgi:hypothetical protein
MKHLIMLIVFSGGLSILFAQNPQVVLREMTGTVELKSGGQTEWIPAQPGDVIEAATVVATGFKSTAILVIGNSTLTIRPLTCLSLEEIMNLDDTETVNVRLLTGRVRAEITPPSGGKTNFTLKSPITIASVRGTIFDIDTVNLRVSEGIVRFESTGERPGSRPVLVGAGQSSRVDAGTGRAVDPITAAETERALPVLPGRTASPGTENTAGLTAGGSLIVDIDLGVK